MQVYAGERTPSVNRALYVDISLDRKVISVMVFVKTALTLARLLADSCSQLLIFSLFLFILKYRNSQNQPIIRLV